MRGFTGGPSRDDDLPLMGSTWRHFRTCAQRVRAPLQPLGGQRPKLILPVFQTHRAQFPTGGALRVLRAHAPRILTQLPKLSRPIRSNSLGILRASMGRG